MKMKEILDRGALPWCPIGSAKDMHFCRSSKSQIYCFLFDFADSIVRIKGSQFIRKCHKRVSLEFRRRIRVV